MNHNIDDSCPRKASQWDCVSDFICKVETFDSENVEDFYFSERFRMSKECI